MTETIWTLDRVAERRCENAFLAQLGERGEEE